MDGIHTTTQTDSISEDTCRHIAIATMNASCNILPPGAMDITKAEEQLLNQWIMATYMDAYDTHPCVYL